MADLTSISSILKSEDFWAASADAQKYLHHKFQDYGYRLATQLGDLDHRSIYMRLAKSEDKAVLDQALSFALDYRDQPNKGKIFMWKLQAIRTQRKRKKDLQNFSLSFVMDQMSETFDEMASEIVSKQKSRLDSTRETLLHKFATHSHQSSSHRTKRTPSILTVGCGSGVDSKQLAASGLKVEGVDVSRQLVKAAKAFCPEAKFVRQRDLLSSKHKPGTYSGIWADKFWQIIPFADEDKYLVRMHELLHPGGHLFFTARINDAAEQKWQELEWRGKSLLSFFKVNVLDDLLTQTNRFGFDHVESVELSPHMYGVWLTKSA